jgi:hypothetical protein
MEFLFIRVTIALAFGLILSPIQGQVELKFVRNLPSRTGQFRVDPLGHTIFFERDAVYKMDTTGNLLFQQSLKAYGAITDLDVTSPMKYLVFFREQQAIGFFDNTFTPYQSRTRLSELGVSYATLVCYSMQFDRFWVYDQDNSKLILFNSDGKQSLETDNLQGLVGIVEPVQMLERNGNLYLVDEGRGVYIFDMFGVLIRFVEVQGIQWIQVNENNFFYIIGNQLGAYNFRTNSKFQITLPAQFDTTFQLIKNKIYLFSYRELQVHKLE